MSGTPAAASVSPSVPGTPTGTPSTATTSSSAPAPVGVVSKAQAAAIERHYDGVFEQDSIHSQTAGLAAVETCGALASDQPFYAARRAIHFQSAVKLSDEIDSPADFVAANAGGYPQHFLYIEHYRQPRFHFDAESLNVFTRASAGAPWRLCSYPNLFTGVALPRLATVAKNVAAPSGPKAATSAAHELGVLAGYLTRRSTAKVAPPKGLVVPFARCPAKYPACNPAGIPDTYFTPTPGVADSYRATVASEPVFTFPLVGGGTLAIGSLRVVDTNTATGNSYLEQDAARSYWNVLVVAGRHHSVQTTDLLTVALEISASGTTVVGADDGPLSAAVTAD